MLRNTKSLEIKAILVQNYINNDFRIMTLE